MKNQLLLIEDVYNVGRSGDLVSVKPGYARNFLLPQKKAVLADARTLRMQAKLKEERAKRAAVDKKEAEEVASRLADMTLTLVVKVDHEGRLYGSVSAGDIVQLFAKEGLQVEKKNVVLPYPIKNLGTHTISVKLKEGVITSLSVVVEGEGMPKAAAAVAPVVEAPAEEQEE